MGWNITLINAENIWGPEKPDYETCKKFGLIYHGGSPAEPFYCDTDVVWTTAFTDNDPVYAIYAHGTNRLVILCKRPQDSEWKEVQLNEIKNLYGLIWKMIVLSGRKHG